MTDRRTEARRAIDWRRFPETEWRDEVRQLGASLLAAESSRTQHRDERSGFGRDDRRDMERSEIAGLPGFLARTSCHGSAETRPARRDRTLSAMDTVSSRSCAALGAV